MPSNGASRSLDILKSKSNIKYWSGLDRIGRALLQFEGIVTVFHFLC